MAGDGAAEFLVGTFCLASEMKFLVIFAGVLEKFCSSSGPAKRNMPASASKDWSKESVMVDSEVGGLKVEM